MSSLLYVLTKIFVLILVNVSKAALKQKKKRQAKKIKKQETADDVQDKNEPTNKVVSNVNVTLTGNPEKDKKIKNIKKVCMNYC